MELMEVDETDYYRLLPLPFLELRQRGEKLKTFYLRDRKVTIGRNPASDIFVASNNVSRTHAILTKEGQCNWFLKDNKSLNGVFWNEVRLQPEECKRLKSGDVVLLGPPADSDFSVKFVHTIKSRKEEAPQLNRPHKISKSDIGLEVAAEEEEKRGEESAKTGELEKKLQVLEEQLREKERVEQELKDKLLKQEAELRENVQERERLLREKEQQEAGLRQNLEKMLEDKERLLRETLANQEQQKMHSERESKARCLEQELVEVQRLRERARADVVGRFGELMETEFTCSICTELFLEAVTLSCAHTFCRLCITQWKKKKKECPVCRAKVKGNETRALAIDNFIDGMVKHLDPEVSQRRQSLVRERGPAGFKNNQPLLTFAQGQLSVSGATGTSVLLHPTAQNNLNAAGIRNPTVVVSRIVTGPFTGLNAASTATVLLPRTGNLLPRGQMRMPTMIPAPRPPSMPAAPRQHRGGGRRRQPPAVQTVVPDILSHQRYPVTAGAPNVMLGQRFPTTCTLAGVPQRAQAPLVLVPGFQYALPRGVVTFTRSHSAAQSVPVISTVGPAASVASTVQYSGTRTQPSVTYTVTGAIPSAHHLPTTSVAVSQPKPSTSAVTTVTDSPVRNTSAIVTVTDSPVRNTSAIVISDEESEESSSSVDGNGGVFYGGYGRCFKCNRRGHWSNGCPFNNS